MEHKAPSRVLETENYKEHIETSVASVSCFAVKSFFLRVSWQGTKKIYPKMVEKTLYSIYDIHTLFNMWFFNLRSSQHAK